MARPKSDEKRRAIVNAAIRVISAQGLGASTAEIAKVAGISNGSLFTYFETKNALLNAVYTSLKMESGEAALFGLPKSADVRTQMLHLWTAWLKWSMQNPSKHRALAYVTVSDVITEANREEGRRALHGVATLLEQSRRTGAMRDAPIALVTSLMQGVADGTVGYMLLHPADADQHCLIAFEAMWRMIQ